MNRRTFLQATAAAGALATFNVRVRGADKAGRKYRTALVGTGWWGGNIVGEAMASGECQVVGLCDVDQRQLDPMAERVTKLSGDQPRKYRDYRELLAREKPEIVIVATPDHWHALPAIAAVKAGAHVYVDKPIAHTIGDWGIHWFDQILWITGEKWPRTVFSTGGRPIKGAPVQTAQEQTSDAPDHQVAEYAFENFTVAWESRQFAGKTDFLDAIKTGRRPICDIEEGHRSTNCSLLGMISYRLGRSVQWDGEKEIIVGDAAANKLLRREYRKGWEYPSS